jgi:uncharacterized membrane protein (UPF0182 family)
MTRVQIGTLVAVLVAIAGLGQGVGLYTDWLWFQEVGYTGVFVTMLLTRAILVAAAAVAVFTVLYVNARLAARRAAPDVLWELDNQLRLPAYGAIQAATGRALPLVLAPVALVIGLGAAGSWSVVLGWFHQGAFGATDPLFERDIGFFVFGLPFWRLLVSWATGLLVGALLVTVLMYVLRGSVVLTERGLRVGLTARNHLLALAGLFLLVKAADFWLDRYELVYSRRGAVVGATYTDVHAALPVLGVLAVLAVGAAVACLVQARQLRLRAAPIAVGALVLTWVLGLGVYPSILQRFRVAPNELAAERPFIEHHIRMTRQAYALDRVEEREFAAGEGLDLAALERNAGTVRNVRLWDHRPLLRTYAQLQEIRTYYKFIDVDVDRYTLDGEYRQVMLSPRELSYAHLPSRSWINERLTFTHGNGVVAGPVARVSPQGLPEFLAWNIPPSVTGGFPEVERPEIYYGELTQDYVLVRTRSQELDYPAGDQNVYTRYAGEGGIPLSSWLRRLAFAARLGEMKIVLSDDLEPVSRVLMHREIATRVQRIAPFLRYDADPYIVVTADGRLLWIIDAYTFTDRYPYADPTARIGNYVRNAVKVTVDAYHGTVNLYLAEPGDPVAAMLARAFPGLLKPLEAMPETVRPHVRYPEALFRIQAAKFATYHMRDPQVFYNREDLWALPQRTIAGRLEEMEPYYTIMRLPGEAREEFILLTLFNPARRDNMIAWLAARSDPPNYGRLVVYMFPKQRLVFGPRQIDARIDQDPVIARQLALWSQAGTTAVRGSLLAIPIEQSLIYVQPLYLAAAEQGALPELRRVIVAHGNDIAMEPTLEQSLTAIFGQGRTPAPGSSTEPGTAGAEPGGGPGRRAWEAWQRAQEALRRGDLGTYGAEQRRLEETLRAIIDSAPPR